MSGSGVPDLATILATAAEIAEGMRFLHERNVLHGDLTGGVACLFWLVQAPSPPGVWCYLGEGAKHSRQLWRAAWLLVCMSRGASLCCAVSN